MKTNKRSRADCGIEPVDEVLRRLFTGGSFARRAKVAELQTCWSEIVGKDAALHCAPAKITDGKLYIHVDSPVWRQQIDLVKEQLVQKVGQRYREIPIAKIICKINPAVSLARE
ncbi:MAG: DUF721 domain-containing protein [Candidatus Abyssobacteria bacterium SURF_5]|uniref:DUF721 domain-containing protein n=1 Tax=Abyssobacteria bacterium (strain SURF_5) TaxID=2093360 RepID=A0A3A4NMS2_ABYX5|nr:MAG: DUF721 domain-containing protein [Candidatus Abyssubacteria bacterium SURF_5]